MSEKLALRVQRTWSCAGAFARELAESGAVPVLAGLLRTAMVHKWDRLVYAGATPLAAAAAAMPCPLRQVAPRSHLIMDTLSHAWQLSVSPNLKGSAGDQQRKIGYRSHLANTLIKGIPQGSVDQESCHPQCGVTANWGRAMWKRQCPPSPDKS